MHCNRSRWYAIVLMMFAAMNSIVNAQIIGPMGPHNADSTINLRGSFESRTTDVSFNPSGVGDWSDTLKEAFICGTITYSIDKNINIFATAGIEAQDSAPLYGVGASLLVYQEDDIFVSLFAMLNNKMEAEHEYYVSEEISNGRYTVDTDYTLTTKQSYQEYDIGAQAGKQWHLASGNKLKVYAGGMVYSLNIDSGEVASKANTRYSYYYSSTLRTYQYDDLGNVDTSSSVIFFGGCELTSSDFAFGVEAKAGGQAGIGVYASLAL